MHGSHIYPIWPMAPLVICNITLCDQHGDWPIYTLTASINVAIDGANMAASQHS